MDRWPADPGSAAVTVDPSLLARLDWPEEWMQSDWRALMLQTVLEHQPTRDRLIIVAGLLVDGTNLTGLFSTRTRAANFVRVSPATGWGVEERTAPGMPAYAREIWSKIVSSVIDAKRDTIAELGPPPGQNE